MTNTSDSSVHPKVLVSHGRFLDQQGASFDDVEKIVLTGLGSTYFHENIFGIPTIHALELDAIGHGGLYLSGLDEDIFMEIRRTEPGQDDFFNIRCV